MGFLARNDDQPIGSIELDRSAPIVAMVDLMIDAADRYDGAGAREYHFTALLQAFLEPGNGPAHEIPRCPGAHPDGDGDMGGIAVIAQPQS